MFGIVIIACVLVAINVAIHAAGLAVLLKALMKSEARTPSTIWSISRLLIGLAWCLLLFHAVEVGVWGVFYAWAGCFPDFATAMYFSGVTYTTTGYGDVVLAGRWRPLAPIEGLTGILMCGLSTGFFFAVVSRIFLPPRAGVCEVSRAQRSQQ
jgi:hypothetical protein